MLASRSFFQRGSLQPLHLIHNPSVTTRRLSGASIGFFSRLNQVIVSRRRLRLRLRAIALALREPAGDAKRHLVPSAPLYQSQPGDNLFAAEQQHDVKESG